MYHISKEKEEITESSIPDTTDLTDGPSGSTSAASATVQFDWFKTKNATSHHTIEYENDVLVLRRGGTFDVGLTFKGVSFSEIMTTTLGFRVVTSSEKFKSIETRCAIVDKIDKSKWQMEVQQKDPSGLHVVLKVNIPVDAIIGRYSVDVFVPSSIQSLTKSQLVILFNPWCIDDEVYLADQEERNEYVMSETGTIYQGNAYYGTYGIMSKRWNYGQFEKKILDCVLFLLEKDKRSQRNPLKSLAKRCSALWVARILSATVNSPNEQGVLVGNWSGYYDDGASPSSWNGSVAILQQYYDKRTPVKYGQCWVFAGIMTTALRALGIPARTVTNFNSAHDTDQSMTIDNFFNEEGRVIQYLSMDSVWNFHVWNEMWAKRKDLSGSKYDGWQVVDATPQEQSAGLYQLGPAPVNAVKEGEIYAGYDTGFVFGEVNADRVEWVLSYDENDLLTFQKPTSRDTSDIGKYISTKKVGVDERKDITHLYKYAEGSEEERKAFETAYSFGAGALNWVGHFNVVHVGKGLTLDLGGEPAGILPNGSDFTAKIAVKNTSQRPFTVTVTAVINSIIYTGEIKNLIKNKKFENVAVGVGQSVSLELPVTAQEYVGKQTELNTMRLVVVAKVKETSKLYVDMFDFQLNNKNLIKVQFPGGNLKVGQKSKVNVIFHNTLPVTLSSLVYTIEGAGLTAPITRQDNSIASGATKTKTFFITPTKSGKRTLLVDIDSYEVKDIKCFVNVNVQP